MKLYCAKFRDVNNHIIDVMHVVAKDDEEMRKTLNATLNMLEHYDENSDYCSYSFTKVSEVEGFQVELKRKQRKFNIKRRNIMLNKQDAIKVKEKINNIDGGAFYYKYTVDNLIGEEYRMCLYRDEDIKQKHIEDMRRNGWVYDEMYSQTNHILYFREIDKNDKSIIVPCAEFRKDIKSLL